jgi:putative endonuclease
MKPKYRRMLRGMKNKAGPPSGSDASAAWHLYILRCGDGSYYTGVTTDIDRRVREHQEGKASRYTRTHLPVALVHREECGDRSRALSRECAVKSLSRTAKNALISGDGGAPEKRRTRKKS